MCSRSTVQTGFIDRRFTATHSNRGGGEGAGEGARPLRDPGAPTPQGPLFNGPQPGFPCGRGSDTLPPTQRPGVCRPSPQGPLYHPEGPSNWGDVAWGGWYVSQFCSSSPAPRTPPPSPEKLIKAPRICRKTKPCPECSAQRPPGPRTSRTAARTPMNQSDNKQPSLKGSS